MVGVILDLGEKSIETRRGRHAGQPAVGGRLNVLQKMVNLDEKWPLFRRKMLLHVRFDELLD